MTPSFFWLSFRFALQPEIPDYRGYTTPYQKQQKQKHT